MQVDIARWRSRAPTLGGVARTVPFTLDHLEALDALGVPCRACVFWELDPVRRTRLGDAEARDVKESWMSEVLREWGSCGRVALVDGESPSAT